LLEDLQLSEDVPDDAAHGRDVGGMFYEFQTIWVHGVSPLKLDLPPMTFFSTGLDEERRGLQSLRFSRMSPSYTKPNKTPLSVMRRCTEAISMMPFGTVLR